MNFKMISMIKSEDAFSETLGMTLMLSITILAISAIMLTGGPMIESSKNNARIGIMGSYFLTMQNDIDEVVRGPIWISYNSNAGNISNYGSSRRTEIELGGGSLAVSPYNISESSISFRTENNNFIINMTTGNITYLLNNEKIIYENGAVIRKYETGAPLMVSDPLINIYNTLDNGTANYSNITVSIHAISLNGTLSSKGGNGNTWAEIKPLGYYNIIPETSVPNANRVNISIYSNYPEAWKNFFDRKLKDAGLKRTNNTDPNPIGFNITGTAPVNITIYGNVKNGTFLSAYNSNIDVNIR